MCGAASPSAAPPDPLPIERLEQRRCLLQVGCVEAFGKPAVNRREKVASLVSPPLGDEQASQTYRGTQFKPACALFPCGRKSQTARSLHLRPIRGRQAAEQMRATDVAP